MKMTRERQFGDPSVQRHDETWTACTAALMGCGCACATRRIRTEQYEWSGNENGRDRKEERWLEYPDPKIRNFLATRLEGSSETGSLR
jgi:hypothetical protein